MTSASGWRPQSETLTPGEALDALHVTLAGVSVALQDGDRSRACARAREAAELLVSLRLDLES